MDLHEKIELRDGFLNRGKVGLEVLDFMFWKGLGMAFQPSFEGGHIETTLPFEFALGKSLISWSMRQVVLICHSNVAVSLNDCWPKVFITVYHQKFSLVPKVL